MPENLSARECRIIGCLMEKSVITPDQYPLTLNALTNACNQKSSRDPVMSLAPGEVQHTVRELANRHLVHIEENFRSGVEKYSHRFCNTTFSELQLNPAQFAIVCLLLLRGPQTPGELRARSGRLHAFADNDAVLAAIQSLNALPGDPLLVQLPRSPGRKDCEYMHLFAGSVDTRASATDTEDNATSARSEDAVNLARLEQRVSALEEELARLKHQLGEP